MRLDFLGVRGSTPAPGADFVRYGGNTSCIAVSGAGETAPSLCLDAGTGVRKLGDLLGGSAFAGEILLSHLHWDHMQGIPFCPALDRDAARVRLHLPAQLGRSARDLIAQSLAPPAFPITPEGLRGDWTFVADEPGRIDVASYDVSATEIAHKGGTTYGYRVERDGVSIGYLPDHAPALGVSYATRDQLRDVDVLIHDAQFLESERVVADLFGHATIRDAIALARDVGAGTLVLFHHGPNRTDAALDRIGEDLDGLSASLGGLRVTVAQEGDFMALGR